MNELNEYDENDIIQANINGSLFNGFVIKLENPDDLIEYCDDDSSAEIEINEFSQKNLEIQIKTEPEDVVFTPATEYDEKPMLEVFATIKTEKIEADDINPITIKVEPELPVIDEPVKNEKPLEIIDVPEIPNNNTENQNSQMSVNSIPKIRVKKNLSIEDNNKLDRDDVVVKRRRKRVKKKPTVQDCDKNISDFFKLLEDIAAPNDNLSDMVLSKTHSVNKSEESSSDTMEARNESKNENNRNLNNTKESGDDGKIRWVIKRGPKRKNEEEEKNLLEKQAVQNQAIYLDKLLESSIDQNLITPPDTKIEFNDQSDSSSSNHSVSQTQTEINKRKAHKCTVCPESFSIVRLFEIHMEEVHKIKPYKCIYCPKEFARSKYLRYHTARHTRENLIKCNQCDGEFARKIDYQRHKESHFGIVYSCNQCAKSFTRLSNLNMHAKRHMGVKPFVCGMCSNKVFYRESTFRRHCEAHEEKVEDWICKLCSIRFDALTAFVKHCKEKHTQKN